jgi:TonB family protein
MILASRPSLLVCMALALGTPQARAQAPAPPAAPALLPPRVLSSTEVPYPEGATGDGKVVLLLLIDPQGVVQEATAREGAEPFASKAAEAARSWRFAPATREGTPVRSRIRFQVIFRAPAPAPEPAATPPAGGPTDPPPATTGVEQKPPPARSREIVVIGERPDPSRSVSLTRAEVRQIPGTFGDPFRAIEVMPGVTPIVSGLPFFFIRGAPPGNAGYFLDGVRVPLLFHIGAGPSVVHPALMDRVDLYPGGYPARYGRFSGGIVAGETMPPLKELHGEYNLRLFDAGALVEAPFADNRGAVLVGGRYSYAGALLTLLSPTIQLEYWDYQARVAYDVTPDDRISVFAFGSYDYLAQRTATTTLPLFGTQFHRVDLRYDHRLGDEGNMRIAFLGGVDRTLLQEERAVRDRLFGVRSEFDYRLASWAKLRAGTDVQFDTYDVELGPGDLGPAAARALTLFPSRSDAAMAARADVVMAVAPGFEVTPGLRVDFFSSQGASALAFDPRLAGRLEVHERARLLSALGIAHQPPAFALPVPGFQPGGLRGGLQRAMQQSLGVELDLDGVTMATATVFRNAFFNMSDPLGATQQPTRGCPPGSFPIGGLPGDQGGLPPESRGNNNNLCGDPLFLPGIAGPDRSGGSDQGATSRGGNTAAGALEVRTLGSAYGLEIFVKRRLTHRLGGFFSYTLSRSTRSVGTNKFIASFDRTHVVNLALAYNLGRGFRAGGRAMFYTGLPKAPDPFSGETRLPPFLRLDFRLEKRWQLGKVTWISIVAEWLNATLNKEALTTRCTLQGCEAQEIGPITIPSLGLEGGF